MSLNYNVIVFRDVFSEIVDSLRDSGEITSVVVENGVSTVTAANSLFKGDVVTIDSGTYKVISADGEEFTVKGDVTGAESYKSLSPYFIDEPIKKLGQTLAEKDKSSENFKFQKYPFIALIYDIDEDHSLPEMYARCKFRFIIGMYTDPNLNSEQRTEMVFKTRLHPIYTAFMDAIAESDYFVVFDSIPHNKNDRYYWGLSDSAAMKTLNDYIDAIELTNLQLDVIEKQCLPEN